MLTVKASASGRFAPPTTVTVFAAKFVAVTMMV